jgi:hypothetical protein
MTFEENIRKWILEWVSQHNPELGAVPCPFAKQALLDSKIVMHELTPMDHIISMPDYFKAELENFTYHWPKDAEVVAIGCDPKFITAEQLQEAVEQSNTSTLIPRGYIALEDHPDAPEIISGVSMNNGEWALVLVQSKEKLDKASAMLDRQGYYNNWSKENLDDVVNWRNTS